MSEFEKWWDKREESQFNDILECEEAWKAALEMIYYKGVLDNTLAGDLIKEELPDGSI